MPFLTFLEEGNPDEKQDASGFEVPFVHDDRLKQLFLPHKSAAPSNWWHRDHQESFDKD